MKDVARPVEEVIQGEFDRLDVFCNDLVYGKVKLC
jgi:hypothetical protein